MVVFLSCVGTRAGQINPENKQETLSNLSRPGRCHDYLCHRTGKSYGGSTHQQKYNNKHKDEQTDKHERDSGLVNVNSSTTPAPETPSKEDDNHQRIHCSR